jgi:hypothetical protein
MTRKKPTGELLKQLRILEEESKKDQKFCEDYKIKIVKELKSVRPSEIKNSLTEEKKTNLWQRILITLGMN